MPSPPESFSLIQRIAITLAVGLWCIHLAASAFDVYVDQTKNLRIYAEKQADAWVVTTFIVPRDEQSGLRLGDRIVQIGDRKTLPEEFVGFRYALNQSGGSVVVERDNRLISVDYELVDYQFPLGAIAKDFVYGIFALIVLAFAPASRQAFCTIIMLLTWTSLGQGAPFGPAESLSLPLILISALMQAAFFPVTTMFLALTAFPDTPTRKLRPALALAGLGAVVVMVFLGEPLQPPIQLFLFVALVSTWMLGVLCFFIWSYPKTTGQARSQANWIGTSMFLTTILVAAGIIISGLIDNIVLMMAISEYAGICVAIGIVLAMLRADFVDIDKTVVLTATYAVLAVIAALFFEFVVQPAAGLITRTFGWSESSGQSALVIVVALLAPWLKQRIQPLAQKYLGATRSHGNQ